jgi:hypothetical protein
MCSMVSLSLPNLTTPVTFINTERKAVHYVVVVFCTYLLPGPSQHSNFPNSHPYRLTVKIIVLCSLLFTHWDCKAEHSILNGSGQTASWMCL